MPDSRFTAPAAAELRRAIREAGGVEVFAIGDVEDGRVVGVTIACRGTEDRVPALLERPRTGQVVIHNHPSGDLRPSEADLHLAARYGEDGVGVVIVDSDVRRSNFVVEPHARRPARVDPAEVERFFLEAMPRAMPGHEPRPTQIALALSVLDALNDERPVIAEAGTGTGKSLAYLVPAALWALANDEKVVVSTYTKSLQAQLLADDLPVLARAGVVIRAAVLQGRSNYLCKRRLGIARAEDADDPTLRALEAWEQTSAPASRSELPLDLTFDDWERVESDSDLTLHVRCPHYATCHYYTARREAAAAQIVVVNHALLLADRALKQVGAPGVLPRYRRVVIDEAHHLEEAATDASASRVSVRALHRAVAPTLPRGRKVGALHAVLVRHGAPGGALDAAARNELNELVPQAIDAVTALRDQAPDVLGLLADLLDGQPLRLTPDIESNEPWLVDFEPPIIRLLDLVQAATDRLSRVHGLFAELALPEADAPPVQDLGRARRRLAAHLQATSALLDEDQTRCRWIDPPRSPRAPGATLNVAPIDVAPVVRALIWDAIPGAAATSATLTVAKSFTFYQRRVGLHEAATGVFPSPFDYAEQALLATARDLPEPDDPAFLGASAQVVSEAVRLSAGGTFVLCTSYQAVDAYARHLAHTLPPTLTVLAQGRTGRDALLRRFRDDPRAILVGTDAFWEGVSVRGWGLRQVILPRLPFRVPSDPLHAARVEAEQRAGRDPFRSMILPQAILRMRQGFGRLIRARSDRGVVLLLDRRLHERAYGPLVLRSLPPASRIDGRWVDLRARLEAHWAHLRALRRGQGGA